MAKRFTDTNKWQDPFFYELPIHMKLLWQYAWEQADGSGRLMLHLRRVNADLGFKAGEGITKEDIDTHFAGKAIWIAPNQLWLPEFMPFQRPNLNSKNASHRTMLNNWLHLAYKHNVAALSDELSEYCTKYSAQIELIAVNDRQSIDSRTTYNSNSNSNSNSSYVAVDNSDFVRQEEEPPPDEAVVLRQAIKHFGRDKSQSAMEWLGCDLRRQLVDTLGGWRTVCDMPNDHWFTIRVNKAMKELLHNSCATQGA